MRSKGESVDSEGKTLPESLRQGSSLGLLPPRINGPEEGALSWSEQSQLPRERILSSGTTYMTDGELLAVLFGTGSGGSAIDLARKTLSHFGGLRSTLQATAQELLRVKGLGPAKATRMLAALELGVRACTVVDEEEPTLSSSLDVYRAYRARLGLLQREVFWVVLLDTRNRRIRDVQISEGSLNAVMVHPREVFRPAVRDGAAKIICLHNHPSGDATPSRQDVALTERLVQVGQLVGIPVLDHVIVGRGDYKSLADEGFVTEMKGD